MAMILKCNDLGNSCNYVVKGRTEEEIFRGITDHVRSSHGMKEVPGNFKEKVSLSIRLETKGEPHLLEEEAA
jgi:predicted small metal-binding protein